MSLVFCLSVLCFVCLSLWVVGISSRYSMLYVFLCLSGLIQLQVVCVCLSGCGLCVCLFGSWVYPVGILCSVC